MGQPQHIDGLDVARSYAQFNRPGGNYILGIGTNGAIDADDLARFCEEHARARVFLITPRVDRSWEGTSVDAIASVARRYDNVRVVEWAERVEPLLPKDRINVRIRATGTTRREIEI